MTTVDSSVLGDLVSQLRTSGISGVKITKLASGLDQIEVHAYHSDVKEAARLATETYNELYGSGNFLMPLPKEGTDKAR